jgi:hypothetical protein
MECGQDRMATRLTRVYCPATTICAKAFVACISVTVPVSNVPAADEFGTSIFH